MPLTNLEVYVIIYFGSKDLSATAIREILRLKIDPLSSVAQNNISQRIVTICMKDREKGHPTMRRSSGEWNIDAVEDFLRRTASDLTNDEQRSLRHIGDAEQEIIDSDVHFKGSKQYNKAHKHDYSQKVAKHKRSSKTSALPAAHTTGLAPFHHYQPHEMSYTTDPHSPRRPRHEPGPPRSHQYQTSDSSTATNLQSPYGSSGNNYGRLIDNQPVYNSAMYGGGHPNAGAPLQSLNYPYPAPTTHSNYHAGAPSQSLDYPYPAPIPNTGYQAGSSDREGECRSTRPTERSGYPSTKPAQKRPLAPGYRDDVY